MPWSRFFVYWRQKQQHLPSHRSTSSIQNSIVIMVDDYVPLISKFPIHQLPCYVAHTKHNIQNIHESSLFLITTTNSFAYNPQNEPIKRRDCVFTLPSPPSVPMRRHARTWGDGSFAIMNIHQLHAFTASNPNSAYTGVVFGGRRNTSTHLKYH